MVRCACDEVVRLPEGEARAAKRPREDMKMYPFFGTSAVPIE